MTALRPQRFGEGALSIDPKLNAGQLSFANSVVRLEDVLRRVRAGEPVAEVAEDFDLPGKVVASVLQRA
jgi:uncharacterized protein (DUF433 family)